MQKEKKRKKFKTGETTVSRVGVLVSGVGRGGLPGGILIGRAWVRSCLCRGALSGVDLSSRGPTAPTPGERDRLGWSSGGCPPRTWTAQGHRTQILLCEQNDLVGMPTDAQASPVPSILDKPVDSAPPSTALLCTDSRHTGRRAEGAGTERPARSLGWAWGLAPEPWLCCELSGPRFPLLLNEA